MSSDAPQHDAKTPARQPDYWPRPADNSLTYVGPGSPSGDSRDPLLAQLIDLFIRRRWLVALGFVPVMALVTIHTLMTPKTYESDATILVEARGQDEDQSALEVLQRLGRANTLDTEIELMTSRRVIEPVVLELKLNASVKRDGDRARPEEVFTSFHAPRDVEPGVYRIERSENSEFVAIDDEDERVLARSTPGEDGSRVLEFNGLRAGLASDAATPILVSVWPFDRAVAGAQRAVSAFPIRRDADLVRLRCKGGSPESARRLCEALTDSYFELRAELQVAEATGAADFLDDQAEEVRLRLEEAENQLAQYQRQNQAVALEARATTEVQYLAGLRAQREQLEAERTALANLIATTEREGGAGKYRDLASYPSFLEGQTQVVSELVQTLVELENRRADLAVTRTERNPDIIAIDVRISDLEEQLHDFSSSYRDALSAQIRSLDETLAVSGGQLASIPEKQVETSRLERQVGLLEDLYHFLQTRLREAEVAKVVTLPSVRIVDEASLPLKPASPNVRMNLALGLFLGLVVGCGLAVGRELTDSRIRERKDVERETGIPVLAMIPALQRPGPIARIGAGGSNGQDRAHGSGLQGLQRVWSRKTLQDEITVEAFRSLAADLQFLGEGMGDGGVRSVAVTSSSRGDGKTFTACNLALAFATRGRRTLLVDADLRASGVSRFFDLEWTSKGLLDVLLREMDPGNAVQELGLDEDGTGLSVITSGNPSTRPAGVIERHSVKVGSVLEFGRSAFDLVVVDTPPLNVLTDAAVVASRVDAVVVVVRGGVTDREALDLTLKRLGRANARVVGLVLNDVDLPEYYTTYSKDFVSEA